jgi:hypothetical protein
MDSIFLRHAKNKLRKSPKIPNNVEISILMRYISSGPTEISANPVSMRDGTAAINL